MPNYGAVLLITNTKRYVENPEVQNADTIPIISTSAIYRDMFALSPDRPSPSLQSRGLCMTTVHANMAVSQVLCPLAYA